MSNETKQKLRVEVAERIFQDKYGVSVTSVERIHRIGILNENRPSPAILNLGNFKEKKETLHNARKLKGTQINEDFSRIVRPKGQNFRTAPQKERKNGKKVALIFDKLKIDSAICAWDEATGQRVLSEQASASVGEPRVAAQE